MWLTFGFIAVVLLSFTQQSNKTVPEKWTERQYHQTDYDITMDIAEPIFVNEAYFRNFKFAFVPMTRTQRALNASGHFLVDLMDMRIDMQMYKFMSNEYRFFPMTISVRLCKDVIDNNLFDMKVLLNKESNVRCPLRKSPFYVTNLYPDASKLPPYIPYGSYKMVWNIYDTKDVHILRIETRGRALEKPLPWTK